MTREQRQSLLSPSSAIQRWRAEPVRESLWNAWKMSRATRYDLRDDLIAESNDLNGDLEMTLTKIQFTSKTLPRPPVADEAIQMIDLDIAIVLGDSYSIYSDSCNSKCRQCLHRSGQGR
jgi:hypothetical protein